MVEGARATVYSAGLTDAPVRGGETPDGDDRVRTMRALVLKEGFPAGDPEWGTEKDQQLDALGLGILRSPLEQREAALKALNGLNGSVNAKDRSAGATITGILARIALQEGIGGATRSQRPHSSGRK